MIFHEKQTLHNTLYRVEKKLVTLFKFLLKAIFRNILAFGNYYYQIIMINIIIIMIIIKRIKNENTDVDTKDKIKSNLYFILHFRTFFFLIFYCD